MEINVNVFHHLADVGKDDRILVLLEKIMSAISDFADKMKVHQDHVDAAVEGISGDLSGLKAQIAALQASAGTITPADQKLLDDIEARTAAIHAKVDALDALTPPVVPTP